MNNGEEVTPIPQDKTFLPVRAIEQTYPWDCGPTAVRTALKYQFGLKLTARDMILLAGATESGSDEFNLMMGLDTLGFKYRQTNRGTFNQLKSCLGYGQVPIVHLVMEDGGGHYMVFCGYDEEKQIVQLADPGTGKIIERGIPFFMGVWKVEEKETQTRWFLVITGFGGDRLDSIIQSYKRIQKKVRNSRK
jgi:predicted double-glycine peptidase